MMSTAARKKADPCFPAVYGLTSARVYHGKRIISTEFDTQTGTGSAPATGQRLRSRLGAEQFHRYFVPMPHRTHPDGRGGVSNRRPENILTRRSKGAPHSGGHPACFVVGYIYGRNCRILRFQRGEVETGLASLRHFSQTAEGKVRLHSRIFQFWRNRVRRRDLRRLPLVLSEKPVARRWFPNGNVSKRVFFVYRCKDWCAYLL